MFDKYHIYHIAAAAVVAVLLAVILVLVIFLCRLKFLVKKLRREISSTEDEKTQGGVEIGVAPVLDDHGNSAITIDRSHDQVPEAGDTSGYESISNRMLQAMAQASNAKVDIEKKDGEDKYTLPPNTPPPNQPVRIPESVPAYSTIITKDLDSPSACNVKGGDGMYATVGTGGAPENSANAADCLQNAPSRYPSAEGVGIIAPQNPEPQVPELPIYSVVKKKKKEDGGCQQQDPYSTLEEVKRGNAEGGGGEGGGGGGGAEDRLPPEQAETLNDYSTIAECLQISEDTAKELISPPPPLPPYTLEMNQLSKAAKEGEEQSMRGGQVSGDSVSTTTAVPLCGGSISDGGAANNDCVASPVVMAKAREDLDQPVHHMQ